MTATTHRQTRNQSLVERAERQFPCGVNSPVRAFRSVGRPPLVLERGEGSAVWDADGRRYLDYVGAWGAAILGHAHPAVVEAVTSAAGHGFGMGVAVVMEPDKADPLRCRGGAGTVGWPGAYGSWWQADPTDGSVLIFLSHNMVELAQMAQGIGLGVWSAIATFHPAYLLRNPAAKQQAWKDLLSLKLKMVELGIGSGSATAPCPSISWAVRRAVPRRRARRHRWREPSRPLGSCEVPVSVTT